MCRPERGKMLLAVFFQIIKHSPVWILPLITANIVDLLSHPTPASPASLRWNLGILALVVVQNIPVHMLFVYFLSRSTRNIEMDLRSAICERLQHLSISFYTRASTGSIQTKLVRDVEAVHWMLTVVMESFLAVGVSILAAIVAVSWRAPWFLVFFFFSIPFLTVIIRLLRKAMRHRNTLFRQELESLSSRLIGMTQLIPITRAHGEEQFELERVSTSLIRVRRAGIRLDTINAFFGATTWVSFQLFGGLVLSLSAWLYYTQWIRISLGDVILLTGYSTTLTGAVLGVSNLVPQISKGFESIRSMGEILECPDLEKNEGRARVKSVAGRFTFDQVGFSYPDTEESALHNISLMVYPGETIAIVGPSGAGKSTLLNLVIGFLRPSVGRMLLDGCDMTGLDLRTYRRFLSLVPQETVLFDGTIRENVTYGSRAVSEAQLRSALWDANALEFVEELPQGLATRIGERGARLSGGQKQRLAIARALIRNPRVLILDEATSALDTLSEKLIQESLLRLMKERTTFVVAHRLSTIRNAHRIVVLENGRMAEIGSHAELLARNGVYSQLQASQL
jgi:ATP-binding cassette, subfamily B, bacterial